MRRFFQHTSESLELLAHHFLHELKAIVSDKGAILILFIAVVIYPIIYSIVYSNETVTSLSVAIVDL